MATKTQLFSDLPIPPGETLAEELEARGLSQTELARQMGRPLQAINMIVMGKKSITEATAIQLEKVLGVSAEFWMNLQTNYNLTKARLTQRPAPVARTASATPGPRIERERVTRPVLHARKPAGRRLAKKK